MATRYKANSTATYVGIAGWQNIRTDPPTHSDEAYVHFAQVLKTGEANGDFVAVGSANGVGVQDCPDQYNGKWDVYTDGRIGGVYFCHTHDVNRFSAGDDIPFKILRVNCGTISDPLYGWNMSMAGHDWACYATSWGTGQMLSVGLEHAGTSATYQTDRNLDVKYTNLQVKPTGGTWSDFLVGQGHTDPSYTETYLTDTSAKMYLAPWD
jgi:hypothetical protein